MRAPAFLTLALALALASPAHAFTGRSRRAEDTLYAHAGPHLGLIIGWPDASGYTLGVQGALGIRLTPDLSVQVSANHAIDLLSLEMSVTGVAVGVSWFANDWVAITANLRHRAVVDGNGPPERLDRPSDAGQCPDTCTRLLTERHTRDLGVEVTLSSVIEWETLTFGFEWLSFHQPLVILDAHHRAEDITGRAVQDVPAQLDVADLPWDVRFLGVTVGAVF